MSNPYFSAHPFREVAPAGGWGGGGVRRLAALSPPRLNRTFCRWLKCEPFLCRLLKNWHSVTSLTSEKRVGVTCLMTPLCRLWLIATSLLWRCVVDSSSYHMHWVTRTVGTKDDAKVVHIVVAFGYAWLIWDLC